MECEYVIHYKKCDRKANEFLNVRIDASPNEETDYCPLKDIVK